MKNLDYAIEQASKMSDDREDQWIEVQEQWDQLETKMQEEIDRWAPRGIGGARLVEVGWVGWGGMGGASVGALGLGGVGDLRWDEVAWVEVGRGGLNCCGMR